MSGDQYDQSADRKEQRDQERCNSGDKLETGDKRADKVGGNNAGSGFRRFCLQDSGHLICHKPKIGLGKDQDPHQQDQSADNFSCRMSFLFIHEYTLPSITIFDEFM